MLDLFHKCQNDKKSKGRLIMDQICGEIFCQECGFVVKERITSQDYEKNAHLLEQYVLRCLVEAY